MAICNCDHFGGVSVHYGSDVFPHGAQLLQEGVVVLLVQYPGHENSCLQVELSINSSRCCCGDN